MITWKIRNQASVELNGQGENPLTKWSQLVREIELTKYKENESAEVLLPEGLFATFALYKVNGNPDAVDENGQVTRRMAMITTSLLNRSCKRQ